MLQKYFYRAHDCSLRIEHITFVVSENQESFRLAEVHVLQFEWCWYINIQSFISQLMFCSVPHPNYLKAARLDILIYSTR